MDSPKMYSSCQCKSVSYLCGTANSQVSQYRAENGNLRKSRSTFCHGTVFAPNQCLYQKETTGIERMLVQKPHLPVRDCKRPLLM